MRRSSRPPTFAFYSDAVINLHDFLVWNSRSRAPVEPAPDCLAGLPAEQRAAFEHAREHYKCSRRPREIGCCGRCVTGSRASTTSASRIPRLSRSRSGSYARRRPHTRNVGGRRMTRVTGAGSRRSAVARGTRGCVERALERAVRQQAPPAVSRRRRELRGYTGADSVVHPDHLLISSVAPANTGYAALEVVFHEASHTVFGPGLDGRLWTELEAAEKPTGAVAARLLARAAVLHHRQRGEGAVGRARHRLRAVSLHARFVRALVAGVSRCRWNVRGSLTSTAACRWPRH